MDHAERVEGELARQIRPLVDHDLAVVFHDLTTVRIHGEGMVEDDLRAFGMNKARGGIARLMSDNQVGRHRQPSWPMAPAGGRA